MKRLNAKILLGLAACGITVPILMIGRGYPWQLALIVGAAVGILAYTTLSTFERLRTLSRKNPHPDGDQQQ
jgi:uncharacterized membrane protein